MDQKTLSKYFSFAKFLFYIFQSFVFKPNNNLDLSLGERINIQAGSLSSNKAIIPFGYNTKD